MMSHPISRAIGRESSVTVRTISPQRASRRLSAFQPQHAQSCPTPVAAPQRPQNLEPKPRPRQLHQKAQLQPQAMLTMEAAGAAADDVTKASDETDSGPNDSNYHIELLSLREALSKAAEALERSEENNAMLRERELVAREGELAALEGSEHRVSELTEIAARLQETEMTARHRGNELALFENSEHRAARQRTMIGSYTERDCALVREHELAVVERSVQASGELQAELQHLARAMRSLANVSRYPTIGIGGYSACSSVATLCGAERLQSVAKPSTCESLSDTTGTAETPQMGPAALSISTASTVRHPHTPNNASLKLAHTPHDADLQKVSRGEMSAFPSRPPSPLARGGPCKMSCPGAAALVTNPASWMQSANMPGPVSMGSVASKLMHPHVTPPVTPEESWKSPPCGRRFPGVLFSGRRSAGGEYAWLQPCSLGGPPPPVASGAPPSWKCVTTTEPTPRSAAWSRISASGSALE